MLICPKEDLDIIFTVLSPNWSVFISETISVVLPTTGLFPEGSLISNSLFVPCGAKNQSQSPSANEIFAYPVIIRHTINMNNFFIIPPLFIYLFQEFLIGKKIWKASPAPYFS